MQTLNKNHARFASSQKVYNDNLTSTQPDLREDGWSSANIISVYKLVQYVEEN